MEELTLSDLELILTSLDYSIRAFESYRDYPSAEMKAARIAEAKAVKRKVAALKARIQGGGA